MAGKKHGKDSHFTIEDSGGTTLRNVGDFCDNIELDQDVDMADSTTIGLEAKTFLSGLAGSAITLAGKWDSVVTVGPDVVLSGLLGLETPVGFEYGPEGNVTGAIKYSGECFVEKYKVSSPLEGVVKFSSTIRVTGIVTRATFA